MKGARELRRRYYDLKIGTTFESPQAAATEIKKALESGLAPPPSGK
jgi:hypothetical protein